MWSQLKRLNGKIPIRPLLQRCQGPGRDREHKAKEGLLVAELGQNRRQVVLSQNEPWKRCCQGGFERGGGTEEKTWAGVVSKKEEHKKEEQGKRRRGCELSGACQCQGEAFSVKKRKE